MTRIRFKGLRVECLEDRVTPVTFNVTTTLDVIDAADGKRSLREAISAANVRSGEDVIVLPAGVYKIALAGAGDNMNGSGDFDIVDAVTIQGAGAGASIIDGQQLDRVFDVNGASPGSIKVILEKMTIRNGDVSGHGGGVEYGNADLVVRDAIVSRNRASQRGGGISNGTAIDSGDAKVVRTTVARNIAGTDGGGIGIVNGLLTLAASTVRRNVSGGTNGGGGFFATLATMTNSTVTGNTAADSGGGVRAGTATITNCTINGNTTATGGGGLFAETATMTSCTVSGNSASERGGGINATTATLTNCTVSGNTAAIEGGGVFATTAALLNCTVVENIAVTGGGLFHVAGGTFSVKNTIVALNLVAFGGNGPDAFGASFTSQGHNLIGDGTGSNGFTHGANGNIVGTSINPIDPKLGSLANNGGPTKTHALLAGSKAIDTGDNVGAPATDQRGAGFPRKKDGDGNGSAIVDIGAFEK